MSIDNLKLLQEDLRRFGREMHRLADAFNGKDLELTKELNRCERVINEKTYAEKVWFDKFTEARKEIAELNRKFIAASNKERRFPMQHGPSIPWSMAEIIYAGYSAVWGESQSLERLAERGGFGWDEVRVIYREKDAKQAIDKAIKELEVTE